MDKIYDKIDEPEIIMKDVLFPERFPAIYIDESDNIYCYHSIIDNNRFVFWISALLAKGAKAE